MKKISYFIIAAGIFFSACNSSNNQQKTTDVNPLLQKFETPFETPPFQLIKNEHFVLAYEEAMKQQNADIEKIASNPDAPTFTNTIEAYDASGSLLNRIESIFNNLTEVNTNDTLQQIAKEISPKTSAQKDNILLNASLFKKIKTVYEQKANLNLNPEQTTLVNEIYKKFVRGGANLTAEQQKRLREINERLAFLGLQFGENLLAETNGFTLVLDKKEDLVGLPDGVISAAAEKAKESGNEGKWVFGLDKPSLIPFLQYSEKRELREKLFKGYSLRGNNNNKNDNKKTVNEFVNLRLEKANLFGFKTYADYILDDRMAKNTKNVYNLLDQVWIPSLKVAKTDAVDLQKMIDKEGGKFKLEPWDWWFYSEKIRKQKYNLDDEALRPYFELKNTQNGLFTVLNKLFGVKIVERTDIPTYHKDAQVYEVQNADGSTLGILYMDFYPRASKRGGAWMTEFSGEYYNNGKRVVPVISTVFNFTKPSGDKPALLNFDEVSTMYHEMGHAIHGLFTNTQYRTLSGTATARDFVELPSQIMENWASEPEVLKIYAKHYKTGEVIPMEYIEKMKQSSNFNQGFISVEFLAAAYLDLSWHTIDKKQDFDVDAFEKTAMGKINLLNQIIPRYRTTYFSHIFDGGYATGYYSYIWAEVLDADGFEAFKEHGIFDKTTADSFRKNILEKGGSEDQMLLYKRFRGADPKIEPMLKRRGLIK